MTCVLHSNRPQNVHCRFRLVLHGCGSPPTASTYTFQYISQCSKYWSRSCLAGAATYLVPYSPQFWNVIGLNVFNGPDDPAFDVLEIKRNDSTDDVLILRIH